MKERIPESLADELGDCVGRTGKRISVYDAMAMIQLKKALSGDIKAFELIRQTVEESNSETEGSGIIRVMITDE